MSDDITRELEEIERMKQAEAQEARGEQEPKAEEPKKSPEISEGERTAKEEQRKKRVAERSAVSEEKLKEIKKEQEIAIAATNEKIEQTAEKTAQAITEIQEKIGVFEQLKQEITEIETKYKIAKEDNDKLVKAIAKLHDRETFIENSRDILKTFIAKFKNVDKQFTNDSFLEHLLKNYKSLTKPEHSIRYFERSYVQNFGGIDEETRNLILKIGDSRKGNNRWNGDANMMLLYFDFIKQFLNQLYEENIGDIAQYSIDLLYEIIGKNKEYFDEAMKNIKTEKP